MIPLVDLRAQYQEIKHEVEAAIVHVTEHGTPEGDYPTYPTSDYGA